MKKRIILACLVSLLVILCIGCGAKADKTKGDDRYTDEELQQKEFCEQTVGSMMDFLQSSDATPDKFTTLTDFQFDMLLNYGGLAVERADFLKILEAWRAGVSECGQLEDIGKFTWEKTNKGSIMYTEADFADRGARVEFVFTSSGKMQSLTISGHYGTGEILEKAALNTLLGMGTVFIVLIFISYMISLFKIISVFEEKREAKKKNKMSGQSPKVDESEKDGGQTVEDDEEIVNDEEIVAVISAAVAAARQGESGGFIVRSIKRKKTNKWV